MIYLQLFWTFFKIGAFTIGGGYAMLPLMQEQVLAHEWMSASQIIDFIAVSESTPGPFAINTATFVGLETAGFFGAVCATLGVVLPSFIIILIVAQIFEKFKNSKTVKGLMTGLKPTVIGLIGSAAVSIAATVFFPVGFTSEVFTNVKFYVTLAIFALDLLMAFKKAHPIIIICLSAAIGIVAGLLI